LAVARLRWGHVVALVGLAVVWVHFRFDFFF
jgi:hypothetical protein